jgi:hypothetical protein
MGLFLLLKQRGKEAGRQGKAKCVHRRDAEGAEEKRRKIRQMLKRWTPAVESAAGYPSRQRT